MAEGEILHLDDQVRSAVEEIKKISLKRSLYAKLNPMIPLEVDQLLQITNESYDKIERIYYYKANYGNLKISYL